MSNQPRCNNCGNYYSASNTRPMCLGAECEQARIERPPHPNGYNGLCIVCCYHTYYNKRPVYYIDVNNFICVRCGKTEEKANLCDCCNESFLCVLCCRGYKHATCCGPQDITFRQEPLTFAHPAPNKGLDDGIGWLNREDSTKVLGRIAPSSWFDPAGFSKNSSRRYASVEIEILKYENARLLNMALKKWHCSVVHDGSMIRGLAGVDKSFEINTSPACGNALLDQIQDLTTGLVEAKAKVSTTCGIHVHVDCRDFGYQEVQKLVKIYWYIEEALFAAVHWTRYGNEFCGHCGEHFYNQFIKGVKPDTKNLKSALIKSIYGNNALAIPAGHNKVPRFWGSRQDHYGRNHEFPGLLRNENRYYSLNLHSYFFRGTVESRIHHGSTDFSEIYNWAKFQVDLFDAVYRIPDTKLNKLLELSTASIEEAGNLVNVSKIKRTLDKNKVSAGLAVLRLLLPENTFNIIVEKINIACHDKRVSKLKTLPCHRLEEPEIIKQEVVVMEAAADVIPRREPVAARLERELRLRQNQALRRQLFGFGV